MDYDDVFYEIISQNLPYINQWVSCETSWDAHPMCVFFNTNIWTLDPMGARKISKL